MRVIILTGLLIGCTEPATPSSPPAQPTPLPSTSTTAVVSTQPSHRLRKLTEVVIDDLKARVVPSELDRDVEAWRVEFQKVRQERPTAEASPWRAVDAMLTFSQREWRTRSEIALMRGELVSQQDAEKAAQGLQQILDLVLKY